MITKSNEDEFNTKNLRGDISAVANLSDLFEMHVKDTSIVANRMDHEFMPGYNKIRSLAQHVIAACIIHNDLKVRCDDCAYFDFRHCNPVEFRSHNPDIHKICLTEGVNIEKKMILEMSAAYYKCGGIHVNKMGALTFDNLDTVKV